MKRQVKTSTALAAAAVLVAGCWEEETTVADGLSETTVETGELSSGVARMTAKIARLQGEQSVELLEETAEIPSEDAAVREAANENEVGDLLEQRLSEDVAGDAAPIERLADADIPTAADLGTDDPLVRDETGPATEFEREASDTGAASQQATEQAREAADSGISPTEAATGQAREAADAEGVVGARADEIAMAAALSPDDFDMQAAREAIESSDLEDIQQQVLISGIESARDEPLILAAVLAQARAELGLE